MDATDKLWKEYIHLDGFIGTGIRIDEIVVFINDMATAKRLPNIYEGFKVEKEITSKFITH